MWQLLQYEDFDVNQDIKIATALFYGLYTDTRQLAEIFHPLDRDMRDALHYEQAIITTLRNSNISLEELEIAGLALLRYIHNEKHRFAVIKVKPCDPNILGLISDFLLQVDTIDTCIVFNEVQDGIKLSVRSCVKEVKACDIIKEYILFPQRGGKLEIPSTTMEVSVPVRTQKQMRSIFDDFFDNYQQVEKNVSSSKQTVNVEPLPLGKPSSFYGGIGDFKISSNVSTTELKANDALTLKLTISGTGNLRYIKDPELKLPADFEVFDPKVDLNIKTSKSGVSGSKTIEYTIIPRYAGNYTIPSVEFSYFDLKSKSYKTLSTQSFDLTVEKSAASDSSNPGIANFSNATKEQVKMLGSDIRFIKTGDYKIGRAHV